MTARDWILAVTATACVLGAAVITAVLAAGRRHGRQQARQAAIDDAADVLRRWDAQASRPPARKPQAAPWPDGDTIVTDGMADAINRMLRGDQRG